MKQDEILLDDDLKRSSKAKEKIYFENKQRYEDLLVDIGLYKGYYFPLSFLRKKKIEKFLNGKPGYHSVNQIKRVNILLDKYEEKIKKAKVKYENKNVSADAVIEQLNLLDEGLDEIEANKANYIKIHGLERKANNEYTAENTIASVAKTESETNTAGNIKLV